jgi:hypothetical protein
MQAVLDKGRCGRTRRELVHIAFDLPASEAPAAWAPSKGDVQLAAGLWARRAANGRVGVIAIDRDGSDTWRYAEGEVTADALRGERPLWRFPSSLETRVEPWTWRRREIAPEHPGVRAIAAADAVTERMTEWLTGAGVGRTWFRGCWTAPPAPGATGAVAFHATLWPARDQLRARRVRRGLEVGAPLRGTELRACGGCADPRMDSIPAAAWERLGLTGTGGRQSCLSRT